MIRIASLLAVSALAFFAVSCGCPQEVNPPALRSMPNFKELPAAIDADPTKEDIPVVPTK